jgi:hypothetical protein
MPYRYFSFNTKKVGSNSILTVTLLCILGYTEVAEPIKRDFTPGIPKHKRLFAVIPKTHHLVQNKQYSGHSVMLSSDT